MINLKKTMCCLTVGVTFVLASLQGIAGEPFEPREFFTQPGAFDGADSHVQGICCNENNIFVVFNNYLFKLDWKGNVVKSVGAVSHSGDPCLVENRLYVAMSTNDECAFYEYDLNLNLLRKIKIPECRATDGITYLNGKFYSGGPSPAKAHLENPLNIYDENFSFLEHHEINFGAKTKYGPQSITTCQGYVFIAYYRANDEPKDSPRSIWINPETQEVVGTSTLNGSNGWCSLPDSMQPATDRRSRLLVAQTEKKDGKTVARFGFFEFDGKTLKDITIK